MEIGARFVITPFLNVQDEQQMQTLLIAFKKDVLRSAMKKCQEVRKSHDDMYTLEVHGTSTGFTRIGSMAAARECEDGIKELLQH